MTPKPADPARPAEAVIPPPQPTLLAVRSLLVLGVACTLFGLTFVIAFGLFNRFERFRPWFVLMGLVLWLGPGVSYLLCVHGMRRERRVAATAGLLTVAVQAVGAGGLLAASVSFEPITPLPILLCVAWLAALGDCARHLLRARRFIASGTRRVRGFEPVLGTRPALPLGPEAAAYPPATAPPD
jgi:hypothetical protein